MHVQSIRALLYLPLFTSLTLSMYIVDMASQMKKGLKKFGYENYRLGQEKAISRILSGIMFIIHVPTFFLFRNKNISFKGSLSMLVFQGFGQMCG